MPDCGNPAENLSRRYRREPRAVNLDRVAVVALEARPEKARKPVARNVASPAKAARLMRTVPSMLSPARSEASAAVTRAARPRLSGADRRSSIVFAAKSVFATNGYDGAKTQQIATAAGVSEALVYRHFPSKAALYRAVLRRVIQEQDAVMADALAFEASGAGLIEMILRSVRHAIEGGEASNAEGMRLVYGSLAADGGYARLVYRRARRLLLPHIRRAVERAVADGDIAVPILAENVVNFVEHVTSMIQMAKRADRPIVDYPGDDAALVADAVRFCARGIGLRPQLVEQMLDPMLTQIKPAFG